MGLHSLLRKVLPALLLVAVAAGHCQANDSVRRAQEELRRRNLFFGDVDGKPSPELSAAIRVYQSHKGFDPTGQLDEVTTRSLNIETAHASVHEPVAKWPDVPVLKSDAARELPPQKQAEMEKAAVSNINASPTPDIPAEAPSGPRNLAPAMVTSFVKDYLRDNERNDLETQLKYYAYPVDYFAHGEVGEKFVAHDNRNYMQRWPDRQYTLTAPVKFAAGPKAGETVLEFPIAFHVRNQQRAVAGKTRNYWTVRPEDGALKIIAIREEHLNE